MIFKISFNLKPVYDSMIFDTHLEPQYSLWDYL